MHCASSIWLELRGLFAGSLLVLVALGSPRLQADEDAASTRGLSYPPPLASSIDARMAQYIARYNADRGNLRRFYDIPLSEASRSRVEAFERSWLASLDGVDYETLDIDGRIDWHLLRGEIEHSIRLLRDEGRLDAELVPLLPFARTIADLEERRRSLVPTDGKSAAREIDAIVDAVRESRRLLEERGEETNPAPVSQVVALRAARRATELLEVLDRWHRFHDGYDPVTAWWVKKPHEAARAAIRDYATFLRERIAGIRADDTETIVGEPIGRAALLDSLAHELIPYSPEELIAIAEKEFAWCDREMALASQGLGFGDDWRAAQLRVTSLHVEPGEQPKLIRDLAHEAVRFLEERDLVTIPELCKETWRMEMMTAERQRVNPYFTGGEVISVSFPTDEMDHDDKLMSLQGNNVHYSRATVHHELIPGHHLQGFMAARYNTHRQRFRTPFLVEGWALYWEMLLWDLGFARSNEDRVGMLFWRKHRCARIIFSLRYHLGEWTPAQAIDFLIERVGHERRNATAEVRRSVVGGYDPLYQAAYMLGGLQIRALHRELVESGTMSPRRFHDTILEANSIPIALIRAKLMNEALPRDFRGAWRFYSLGE
jgi:uncharacterized protein (DUF885 family)